MVLPKWKFVRNLPSMPREYLTPTSMQRVPVRPRTGQVSRC